MTKQEAIAIVRRQFQQGDVAAINVYALLERWLSAAQITALLKEWRQSG